MPKVTALLHQMGQSLWLDNITRNLLDSGTLQKYIDDLSVTGLTSNPTIFDHAIKNSNFYDSACNCFAAAMVLVVSYASFGETSSETQPSTPLVRS